MLLLTIHILNKTTNLPKKHLYEAGRYGPAQVHYHGKR